MNQTIQRLLYRMGDIVFPRRGKSVDFKAFSSAELLRILPKAAPFTSSFSKVSLAVLSYKHPIVRALIWQIKYKKDTVAIEHAGYILSKFIHTNSIINPVIVIPIPVSPARRRERGYNQCELLAQSIKKHIPDQIEIRTDILIRSTHTQRQTLQNREERLRNMRGVFSINKKYGKKYKVEDNEADSDSIKNSHVIILDDVITTGSTTHEAEKKLIETGFKHISILAVAH